MKIFLSVMAMGATILGGAGCAGREDNGETFQWTVDRFDDINVMRYQVPGFETLPLETKMLVYYLSEAALSGRDILFDQNFSLNLPLRRTLEAIYRSWEGERSGDEWAAFEIYLKKVWFANGVHHHYSGDKFTPGFSAEFFDALLAGTPNDALPLDFANGNREALAAAVKAVIFDPAVAPLRMNQAADTDLLATSAMNYYEGVSQAEAEKFYADMAAANADDPAPISYGLNSKLTKQEGKPHEIVWREGGMYGGAISQIVFWLEKAREVAQEPQREILGHLIKYYRSGNLRDFDAYNVAWVRDTVSKVDFVNGFIENYGDPLGFKASWEANANFVDEAATHRTQIIGENAQWFEDNSPVDPQYRKKTVKGVSAKVITAAILGGDCYPATPIGINLPNADWIRREVGSKSVTIQNITDAYSAAAEGNGFREEFVVRAEDRRRLKQWGGLGGNLHTDLHECLGHGSGQLAPGVTGAELRQYGSVIEECRADLFALYYIADPRMVELGLISSLDVARAEYSSYMMNGLMTQLARIEPGKNVEQAHMRNRQAIASWCHERGRAANVIEKVVEGGKTYVVVNDFEALRGLVGELLREIQRIKSEGDFEAARNFIETYGVKVDPALHAEVLTRYNALNLAPYGGFVNPRYELVRDGVSGEVTDVRVSYDESYADQMMRYSRDYSFLPSKN
ncbi:MAG: dipeptidyl peptidase 3 [Alistipes sp.]|jgi:dipeptidyl-peptidase-3|nr:dipeptidyl peptidase 3 [Alistipes sp.]